MNSVEQNPLEQKVKEKKLSKENLVKMMHDYKVHDVVRAPYDRSVSSVHTDNSV